VEVLGGGCTQGRSRWQHCSPFHITCRPYLFSQYAFLWCLPFTANYKPLVSLPSTVHVFCLPPTEFRARTFCEILFLVKDVSEESSLQLHLEDGPPTSRSQVVSLCVQRSFSYIMRDSSYRFFGNLTRFCLIHSFDFTQAVDTMSFVVFLNRVFLEVCN
jgi:hypothetical protein